VTISGLGGVWRWHGHWLLSALHFLVGFGLPNCNTYLVAGRDALFEREDTLILVYVEC